MTVELGFGIALKGGEGYYVVSTTIGNNNASKWQETKTFDEIATAKGFMVLMLEAMVETIRESMD